MFSDCTFLDISSVLLLEDFIPKFLDHATDKGYAKTTIDAYKRSIEKLYQYLPEEKRITHGTLLRWRETLEEEGYAANSINGVITAANSYLEFVGAREYQLIYSVRVEPASQPEISRSEYLRLFSAARAKGRERAYFLIKIFVNTGLPLQEVEKITVEAVNEGKLDIRDSGAKKVIYIPPIICDEVLAYANREGLESGPIFLTRAGTPMSRKEIARSIAALAQYAEVPAEKCTPRCLRKLYQTTREAIERQIAMLVEQEQESLLKAEQLSIGWEHE